MATTHHYTEPSRLTRAAYRLLYDPLRAGYLRRLVASLELTGTERVLDFGSGAGAEAVYLAQTLGRGGRLTCLDVSPTWLAEARRRLRRFTNVEFLLGEAPTVGLPEATFDVILANFVLHDLPRTRSRTCSLPSPARFGRRAGSSSSNLIRGPGRGAGSCPRTIDSRRASYARRWPTRASQSSRARSSRPRAARQSAASSGLPATPRHRPPDPPRPEPWDGPAPTGGVAMA